MGRGTAKQGAITQFANVRDNGWLGEPETWRIVQDLANCTGIVDSLGEFRVTEGSMDHSPLVFEVETVLWPTTANQAGKWYWNVYEAAEQFMVRCHKDEAQVSRQRQESTV